MPVELTLAEMETHLNMTADNRGEWVITSDDPVMCRRFEAIGAVLVRTVGQLREYTLPANQISLRNPSKLTDAQREELAERARQRFSRNGPLLQNDLDGDLGTPVASEFLE